MIQNKRQYNVTKRQIAKLEDALGAAREIQGKMPPELYAAMVAGIESQIEDLRNELTEYEALHHAKTLNLHSIAGLPEILIQARIARGYTQEDLAKRLAIKPQQIQRYEKEGYQSVSFKRLVRIAKALDVDFEAPVSLRRDSAAQSNAGAGED